VLSPGGRPHLFLIEKPLVYWAFAPALDAPTQIRDQHLPAREDCVDAWKVTDALYASELSDKALAWLVRNGVIRSEQLLRSMSNWLEDAEA
jgi:hypothetical protein